MLTVDAAGAYMLLQMEAAHAGVSTDELCRRMLKAQQLDSLREEKGG